MATAHFSHLSTRCTFLIRKYALPLIRAEKRALMNRKTIPVDTDNLLALRLITHAELECYFEEVALTVIENIKKGIDQGQTSAQSALVFLYLQNGRIVPTWSDMIGLDESQKKLAYTQDFINLLNASIEFAKTAISGNNGLKEDSIKLLSAISGRFPGEISELMLTELDKYYSDWNEVAHKSLRSAKNPNLQSATIEKNRIENILQIIHDEFDRYLT